MDERVTRACAAKGWSVEDDRITIALEDGRHQAVFIESFDRDGSSFLRLYSPLGDAAAVDERRLRAALRLNWSLPFGSVAIAALGDEGERLMICACLGHEEVDELRLALQIEQLARAGDRYERFVFGTDEY